MSIMGASSSAATSQLGNQEMDIQAQAQNSQFILCPVGGPLRYSNEVSKVIKSALKKTSGSSVENQLKLTNTGDRRLGKEVIEPIHMPVNWSLN